jgi:hypothetical protein
VAATCAPRLREVVLRPEPAREGALVLRCDGDERPMMLAARPNVFWVTPHYEPSPSFVLVRMEAIDPDELRERLEDAWTLAAPRRLLNARQSSQPT